MEHVLWYISRTDQKLIRVYAKSLVVKYIWPQFAYLTNIFNDELEGAHKCVFLGKGA